MGQEYVKVRNVAANVYPETELIVLVSFDLFPFILRPMTPEAHLFTYIRPSKLLLERKSCLAMNR